MAQQTPPDIEGAKWFWRKSFDYDFERYTICADESLRKLKLACLGPDNTTVYASNDGVLPSLPPADEPTHEVVETVARD